MRYKPFLSTIILILNLFLLLAIGIQKHGLSFELLAQNEHNYPASKPILIEREANIDSAPSSSNTVVLANKNDPFYSLAEEIARKEDIPIAHSPGEVFAREPLYLLWVASPSYLSDRVLIDFSLALKKRKSGISIGIISGSTLESARKLWQRAGEAKGGKMITANAPSPAAHIKGKITTYDKGKIEVHPINKENLQQAFQKADYLTFTGHGGTSYLRLDENSWLRPADIPLLPPIIITAASCNTFRLWEKDSIALTFINKGAAAYAGFVYSPNAGYLIGEINGLPFRHSWPDFPIGHIVMVQNRGTLQGFAQFPYYYLLGEPRIAFQDKVPYHLIEDYEEGNRRTMTYTDAPAGFIPVIIPGGARYSLVEIPGITTACDHYYFYNARLQMVNIKEDKYLLFAHRGGDFTLQLSHHPQWYWVAADILLDSLDYTLIYLPQTGGEIISVSIAGIIFLVVIWLLRRRTAFKHNLMLSTLIGAGLAALQGLYALVRLDNVTIISKTIKLNPLSLLSTALLIGGGSLIFLNTRSIIGKGAAILLAAFPAFAPALFILSGLAIMNSFFFKPKLGVGLYNYSIGLLPLITLIIECFFFGLIFTMLNRLIQRVKRAAA